MRRELEELGEEHRWGRGSEAAKQRSFVGPGSGSGIKVMGPTCYLCSPERPSRKLIRPLFSRFPASKLHLLKTRYKQREKWNAAQLTPLSDKAH
ncbi:hypothetical protein E2C01_078285 [Portunus trituberculatus]|uniref:Uncharacterized protein n=1 Tax=Portunus trituberculatus TaxID=210409 RepID=A0A5B7IM83_PORTR|nr:hypothetical protein [Portunus trituberculatus]